MNNSVLNSSIFLNIIDRNVWNRNFCEPVWLTEANLHLESFFVLCLDILFIKKKFKLRSLAIRPKYVYRHFVYFSEFNIILNKFYNRNFNFPQNIWFLTFEKFPAKQLIDFKDEQCFFFWSQNKEHRLIHSSLSLPLHL